MRYVAGGRMRSGLQRSLKGHYGMAEPRQRGAGHLHASMRRRDGCQRKNPWITPGTGEAHGTAACSSAGVASPSSRSGWIAPRSERWPRRLAAACAGARSSRRMPAEGLGHGISDAAARAGSGPARGGGSGRAAIQARCGDGAPAQRRREPAARRPSSRLPRRVPATARRRGRPRARMLAEPLRASRRVERRGSSSRADPRRRSSARRRRWPSDGADGVPSACRTYLDKAPPP